MVVEYVFCTGSSRHVSTESLRGANWTFVFDLYTNSSELHPTWWVNFFLIPERCHTTLQ